MIAINIEITVEEIVVFETETTKVSTLMAAKVALSFMNPLGFL